VARGDLSNKQKQALKNPYRLAILDYLRKQKGTACSVDWMLIYCKELADFARHRVFYHVGILVEAGLVEKIAGTNLYRVVES
jgi:hypothetical protein